MDPEYSVVSGEKILNANWFWHSDTDDRTVRVRIIVVGACTAVGINTGALWGGWGGGREALKEGSYYSCIRIALSRLLCKYNKFQTSSTWITGELLEFEICLPILVPSCSP